jgi:hypothetical protein
MSTHLLETGEEDYALLVVNHVAQLLDGGEQVRQPRLLRFGNKPPMTDPESGIRLDN